MDFSPNPDFSNPHPILPNGVVQCEGFGHASWITKSVMLLNESGVDVARGICHSVKAELVVDNDGMPLDNDHIAVQITKLLLEEDVASKWMFSMRAWHIRRMFLNGASLYDHDQRHICKAAIQALNHQLRRGTRQYNLEHERGRRAPSSKEGFETVYTVHKLCVDHQLL